MNDIEHIMIATDGSELAYRAAKFGGNLARALSARVSLVMVHDERAVIPDAWQEVGLQYGIGATPISTEDVRARLERSALENDLAKTASATGNLPTAPALVNLWGHPADQICDYAAANNVDMIVIGSHGRSGIKQAILGSVSHSVANRAPCAVTIVR